MRDVVVFAFLQVDRPFDAEVAHRVSHAGVGVPGVCNRLHGGGKLTLSWLAVNVERVAPLLVARAGGHLPRWLQRRRLGLGADVIEHQHGDQIGVLGLRLWLARVGEAVDDEAGGVAVQRALLLFGWVVWHPEGLAVGLDHLFDEQHGLAFGRQ